MPKYGGGGRALQKGSRKGDNLKRPRKNERDSTVGAGTPGDEAARRGPGQTLLTKAEPNLVKAPNYKD